jgi:Na+-translocating ferredoxin:NAD+ oxidoreductase subunit B
MTGRDYNPIDPATLATWLDALLPQTQCRRCGFDGCRPYAEALAEGAAAPNRCPPGGAATLTALANALGCAPPAPDPAYWPAERPTQDFLGVAVIDEALCIGCFKCVLVCPVDAIIGAPKFMHTVFAAECSGCELCLPPCPVNCISMQPRAETLPTSDSMAPRWRNRHLARRARLAREGEARDEARRRRRAATLNDQAQGYDIAAAIARAKARKVGEP